MKYNDLLEICINVFGTDRPAEIARELNVTPQAINNWKVRDQVPYKYVKKLKSTFDEHRSVQVPDFLNVTPIQNIPTFNNSLEDIFNFLSKLYKIIKKNITILSLVPVILTILVVIKLKFFTELKYQSSSKVLPLSTSSNNSTLANLASNYGFRIGGQTKNTNLASSEMIPAIIKSRYLRTQLLKTVFHTSTKKDSLKLLSILLGEEIELDKNNNPKEKEQILNLGLTMLDESMYLKQEKGSPLLAISFVSNEPQLAKDMLDKLLVVLQKVMKEFKLERILEKRKFIKDRMIQIKQDLAKIEEDLKEFREQNRRISDSPFLMLQQERFIRDLQVQNELYITMKAEHELARIEEVEVGSFIQILDSPSFPIRPINLSIKLVTIVILFTSFVIILFLLFAYDFYKSTYHTKKILNVN
jgi:uncharacterized protein involved in exopolysaccharide biosynthesis